MHVVEVENVPIEFPFEPYECQKKFMTNVIKALQTGNNAALESPTGTGKTLSLLCASLAWLEQYKATSNPSLVSQISGPNTVATTENSQLYPTIIYASRTHSQLQQVVRELNKTRYKYMKACVLASRDQLCINEKVLKEPNSQVKGQICRNLVKAHKCIYSNTLEKDLPRIDEMYKAECADVPDIEDLITIAKKFKHCPYFRTQNVSEKADLILMPYNYVFDPKVRKAMKVNLKGNILIIDEAHNLESTCEDSISIEWSSKDLALCIDEVKKVLELLVEDEELKKLEGDTNEVSFHQLNPMEVLKKEKEPKLNMNDVAILLKNLQDLDEVLYEFGEGKNYAFKPQEIANGLSGQVFPGEQMIKLLEKANFHRSQRDAFLNVMDQIGFYLAKKAGDNGGLWAEKGIKLSEFSALIARVFSDTFEASDKPITKTSANEACEKYLLYKTKEDDAVVLKYWCFSASVAMRLVNSRGLKSVIVASGTLSPLPAFTASLGIHFEYTLENLHIAKSNQVLVGALEKGPNNTVLFGSFQNRSNENYIKGIAQTLLRTMETTPQGMLVFFASYTQMKSMISSFINLLTDDGPSYWTKMEKLKKLFVEPKDKKDLPKLMADFDQAIRGDFGAALFAVCRGKISEGIDLPDSHCRAVFIIGVPFSPMNDPRVILKKKFLQMQQLKVGNQRIMLTPDQWYEQEAYRAVNQAIGRVIRHKDDFGIVVLADSRFVYNSNRNNLSAWLRPELKTYTTNFDDFFTSTRRFFSERGLLIEKSMEKLRKELKNFSKNDENKKIIDLEVENGFDSINELYGEKETTSSQKSSSQKSIIAVETIKKPETTNPTQNQRKKIARLAVAGVASKNYFDTNSTNSSQKRPANTRANDDGVQVKKPTLDRPGKLALYRANLNKLPTNLKKAIQDAQKKFCLTQKLDDVVPALKDAIPHNPQVFIGFREFLSDDRHSEFDAILRQHGL